MCSRHADGGGTKGKGIVAGASVAMADADATDNNEERFCFFCAIFRSSFGLEWTGLLVISFHFDPSSVLE